MIKYIRKIKVQLTVQCSVRFTERELVLYSIAVTKRVLSRSNLQKF